jgi:sigma-E factor negative regulatory protein RseC
MIETEAVVVRTDGPFAYVKAQRKASCGGCGGTSCGTSTLAGFFEGRAPLYRARNTIGAQAGDRVMVGLEDGALLKGTLAVYLVPLLFVFAGAILGGHLAASPEMKDGYSMAGALAGLVAGSLWMRVLAGLAGHRFQPVILNRISDSVVHFVEVGRR